MKNKRSFVFFILLITLAAFILSGCYGPGMAPGGFGGTLVSPDGKQAYLALNQYVYAVDLASGRPLWRFPDRANAQRLFYASPQLTGDGQLIVGSYDSILYSLNPATGATNWTLDAGARFLGGPLVVGETIYAPNEDGNLYAVDLQGKEVWTFKAGSALWAAPAADDSCDCLFLTSMDHKIYSINITSGRPIWERDLGNSMVGTPTVGDGVIYIGHLGKEMVALDADTGEVVWSQPTENWAWAGPAINAAKDTLYFGDTNGNFSAVSAADGSTLWTVKADGPITSTPVVTADKVYFNTETGTLYAYNLDGSVDWQQVVEGKLYASPTLNGDAILVVPAQGRSLVLVAINQDGGSEKWRYDGKPPED